MRLRARELDLNDPTRNELAVDTIKRLTEENRAKLGELGTCYCRIKALRASLDEAEAKLIAKDNELAQVRQELFEEQQGDDL